MEAVNLHVCVECRTAFKLTADNTCMFYQLCRYTVELNVTTFTKAINISCSLIDVACLISLHVHYTIVCYKNDR